AWIAVSLTVSRLHVSPKPLALIVARDDRERRGALAKAQRMEKELREVLGSAPAALWRAERLPSPDSQAGWHFTYLSPLLGAIAGQPAQFFDHPLRWADVIYAGDRERYRTALRKLLTGSDLGFELEYRVSRPSGEVRMVRDRTRGAPDESGRPIRLDGSITDITAYSEAEEAMRQSERRFRALVEKGGDGIVLVDEKATILYASPSVEKISGYNASSLIGRNVYDLIVPGEAPSLRRQLRDSLKRAGEGLRWRGRIFHADGREQLVEINVCNRLKDPSVCSIVLNYRDVSERDRLEEALRQAAKMEAVGRLAGGIAHDFNNLLTVVLGNLELVRGGIDPADADELLASAESAAKQGANLTRQMLGFARRQPLQSIVIDLNAVVTEEISLLRHSIDLQIAIEFKPGTNLHPAFADPVQIQQVLMNLCLNARDAMPNGGTITIVTENADIPPAANVDGSTAKGYVRVSVADTGVGMTEEVRAKVFEPFFTTKDVGRGTGLGLAVVYGVARAHGGWVECHSTPGRGSRFDVYLPYAQGGEAAAVPETASPSEGRGESILLADDEPSLRALAQAGLARHGFQFQIVEDGAEAVEAFRKAPTSFSLVVLDLMMPVMTGSQAFEAIREIDPNVLVLFASGYSAEERLPDPLPPGTAFLPKPYTPSQLTAAIRHLLDGETQHVGEGI
ncbi:MAG TPA: PAS domain S-box protein, partial [Urbifossiella sp.]